MKLSALLGAALMVGTILPAGSAPLPSAPSAGDGLLTHVAGCHSDVQRHFVPEFGRRAWHLHRGSRCRPVEVGDPRPPLPGPDCHRDVRRHFLPQYGRVMAHRHVGPGCRAQIFEPVRPGRPPSGFCVTIGNAQFCVNQ